MRYLATINTPGYLPTDDDPPVFDTAAEAWEYLADERANDLDVITADATYAELFELSLSTLLTGSVTGATPGYDGDHDLGLAYTVTAIR